MERARRRCTARAGRRTSSWPAHLSAHPGASAADVSDDPGGTRPRRRNPTSSIAGVDVRWTIPPPVVPDWPVARESPLVFLEVPAMVRESPDPYLVLGVSPTATQAEITHAY